MARISSRVMDALKRSFSSEEEKEKAFKKMQKEIKAQFPIAYCEELTSKKLAIFRKEIGKEMWESLKNSPVLIDLLNKWEEDSVKKFKKTVVSKFKSFLSKEDQAKISDNDILLSLEFGNMEESELHFLMEV